VSRALYGTLDRLGRKGFIEWEVEPTATPERGGHLMRKLHVTEAGLDATRRPALRGLSTASSPYLACNQAIASRRLSK
jgi:hypothetical protein